MSCTTTDAPRPKPHPPWLAETVQTLRQRRKSLGLSQEEVNARIGMAENLVAKWETGVRTPSPQAFWWWAEALGCRLSVVVVADVRR
jgi:transcriptional regulator with XRE-family HTH domain